MSSFHKNNLGSYGANLTADMDGYVHTTIGEWMAANVDFGNAKMTREQLRDWAREQAAESRKQVADAERGLAEWRRENA